MRAGYGIDSTKRGLIAYFNFGLFRNGRNQRSYSLDTIDEFEQVMRQKLQLSPEHLPVISELYARLLECLSPAPVLTYNGEDKHLGGVTYGGGHSESIVVDEVFVVKVPKDLDLAAVAPLLCAGITTYSPLRHWKVGNGQKVGRK